jgi:hypothetical protein
MFGSAPYFSAAVLVNNLDYYTNTTGSSPFNATFLLYNTGTGKAISGSMEASQVAREESAQSWGVGFGHIMVVLCVVLLIAGRKRAPQPHDSEVNNPEASCL